MRLSHQTSKKKDRSLEQSCQQVARKNAQRQRSTLPSNQKKAMFGNRYEPDPGRPKLHTQINALRTVMFWRVEGILSEGLSERLLLDLWSPSWMEFTKNCKEFWFYIFNSDFFQPSTVSIIRIQWIWIRHTFGKITCRPTDYEKKDVYFCIL